MDIAVVLLFSVAVLAVPGIPGARLNQVDQRVRVLFGIEASEKRRAGV